MSRLAWAAVTALFATSPALAQPVVLELFTSQGCSSCPPADTLLTELAGRSDVLPLAFHVDYWNRLGWQDAYSSHAYTARQQRYAGQLPAGQVYTPQLVVNGRRDAVGSDRRAVLSAISAAKSDPQVPVTLTRTAAGLAIEVGPGAGSGTVWLVGFDARHSTQVASGENSGRTLTESNIVRSLGETGTWRGQALHLSIAAPQGERIAVLLQASDGAILGAATLVE
jgi:hypothetical protein